MIKITIHNNEFVSYKTEGQHDSSFVSKLNRYITTIPEHRPLSFNSPIKILAYLSVETDLQKDLVFVFKSNPSLNLTYTEVVEIFIGSYKLQLQWSQEIITHEIKKMIDNVDSIARLYCLETSKQKSNIDKVTNLIYDISAFWAIEHSYIVDSLRLVKSKI